MIRRGRAARIATAVGLIIATSLFASCVYLRLLALKHQIADFDRNFAVQTTDSVRITCLHPVLLSSDVRWIGLVPERVKRLGRAAQWQVRWIKQLPPGVRETGAFDIVVELTYVDDKLTRVAIPERYFALMPKDFLIDLLRSLGTGKIDRDRRSIETRLAGSRPDLPQIEKLLGRPTDQAAQGPQTSMRYRYVPVGAGTTRAAVFDMSLYFDRASGALLRWQGRTPVGNIGFNFEPKSADRDR